MNPAINRCDILDVLEEATTQARPVQVELADGRHFVDNVRDVLTESGEDIAVFQEKGRVAVREIARCEPTPGDSAPSYDDKL